jgi:hypothetical protein
LESSLVSLPDDLIPGFALCPPDFEPEGCRGSGQDTLVELV